MLVNYGKRVGSRTHLAGAGDVVHRADSATNPLVEGVVGFELLGCRLLRRAYYLPHFGVLGEAVREADTLTQTLDVEGVAEIVVVQNGLNAGIGGDDTELAGGQGEVDADRHEEQTLFGVEAHDLNHVVAEVRAFGGVAEGDLLRADAVGRDGEVGVAVPAHGYGGMVAQVLADAGQVVSYRDARGFKLRGVADAGEHEQVGRADCACAEYDLACLDDEALAAAYDFDSGCAFFVQPVEYDALHGAVGADSEVEAMAHGVDVAERGAPADAVGVVEGVGADAGCVRVVVVGVFWEASLDAGVVKGDLVGEQVFELVALGDDGAVAAVEVVLEVQVGFELAIVWQDILEAPLIVAEGDPVVEVVGDGAEEDLSVDGAGAAHDLAAWDVHRRGGIGRLAGEEPVVAVFDVEEVRACAKPELDVVWHVVEVGVVCAGFEQQDGARGVFGKPRRNDRARGAATYDDCVVSHWDMVTQVAGCRRSGVRDDFTGGVYPCHFLLHPKSGIVNRFADSDFWIPACAGMTM